MSPQLRIGWTTSIAFHSALFLLAIFTVLPEVVRTPEFVEMDWGALPASRIASEPASTPVTTSASATTFKRAKVANKKAPATRPSQRRITLPERRMADVSDDAISVSRRSEKMDLPGPDIMPERIDRSATDRLDPVGMREQTSPGRASDRPGPTVAGTGGTGNGVARPGIGSGTGSGVGFDVQWTGGGSRRKLSGDLPRYPEGTNVAAQVLIRTSVQPDGSVRSVQPIQKANTALEEAAMRELKLWKFEPLPAAAPQTDQDCVVTFLFRLR